MSAWDDTTSSGAAPSADAFGGTDAPLNAFSDPYPAGPQDVDPGGLGGRPPFEGLDQATDTDDDEDDELVRPFVITGGRTRHASVHLRVETLVVATDRTSDRLQFEHDRIVRVCGAPISVAEVAARIDIPLGVAQILVGDLAEAGLVQIHEARQAATPALLLRMIDAVRAL